NGIVTDHYSKAFAVTGHTHVYGLRDKPEYPIEEGRLLTENVARIKYKNGSIAHFKIKITKNDFDRDADKLPRSDKAYGSIGFPSVIWRKGEDAGGYGSDHLAAWDLRSPAEETVYDNGFGKSAVRMPVAPYSAGDGAKGAGLADAPGTARRYVTEERDVDPILMKKKLAAGWIADNRNNQIRRMYVAVSLPAGTGKETRLKLAKDIVDHSGMLISSNYEYMKDCGEDILGIPPDPSETVTLGSWPQSGDKKEPIEWIVLARLGRNKLYVISKYVLERRVFDESDKDVKWKDCSLRRWLNDGFYKAAFSAEEKKRILVSDVATRENKMERYNDPQVITYTKDKLFIPCGEEINNFFYHQRGCAPTKHARDRKLGVDERTGFAYWWLRGVGFGSAVATSHSPTSTFEKPNSDFAGVRPMMWITAK
ncbi:MAG: hypothetical protein ILO36_08155, partial [Abditibacteriota bacterium]|nr:hypothetical protein [Abditibacteriota bacterium]